MIIDYDHNPALTEDEKLRSLVENLILAFGETTDLLNRQQKQMDLIVKAIGTVSDDISGIRSDITTLQSNVSTIQGNITTINGKITTINGNITTMQDDITALEAVAADAILQSTAS